MEQKTTTGTSGTSQRRKPRQRANQPVHLQVAFETPGGGVMWESAQLVDYTDVGFGLQMETPLPAGSVVIVRGAVPNVENGHLFNITAEVRWCMATPSGAFRTGLSLEVGEKEASFYYRQGEQDNADASADYYDVLQLSSKADPEMIHRVYRILAQRFHPDNQETGDADNFRILNEAYRVLGDPEKRAAYDVKRHGAERARWKIFRRTSLECGAEEERAKRRGILQLLYVKRLRAPELATMTIHEFEDLLQCPREHLSSSLWFLQGKGWITRGDSGRYAITVNGFEQAEEAAETSSAPDRRRLLSIASGASGVHQG